LIYISDAFAGSVFMKTMRDMIRVALVVHLLSGVFAAPAAAEKFANGFLAYTVGDHAAVYPRLRFRDMDAKLVEGCMLTRGDPLDKGAAFGWPTFSMP
jgi:hypothetical protein